APFQNTLLSTREFQQRLLWLHKAAAQNEAANQALDLYIAHLDMDLSSIDSMAARLMTGVFRDRFLQFAAQHDGKVKSSGHEFAKLQAYYRDKSVAYAEAMLKTQTRLDSIRMAHGQKENQRLSGNIAQELTLNLKEAYRQLGYDTAIAPRSAAAPVYSTRITSTGWYNIDKAVLEATTARTTLDYTDSSTGKKAVILYEPVSFRVADSKTYDRLFVYLLPDKINSFMRLDGNDGVYTEKLNELMHYKMICIGWKGEQAFIHTISDIRPGDYPPFTMEKIDGSKLDEQLSQAGNAAQSADMKEETAYWQFEIQDEQRQTIQGLSDVNIARLLDFLIPCGRFKYVLGMQ
ncbi:MAG: hypothetical protein JST39_11560, partial [Bacteroidetes bacterium]|nr:hypothetical protein [Bacteroidota bacterium]